MIPRDVVIGAAALVALVLIGQSAFGEPGLPPEPEPAPAVYVHPVPTD